MSKPSISVLMPVRNGMPYLVAAVDSFLKQDWPEKQLIIVDGESQDGGADYLATLGAPNITVVTGPDSGATEALNLAATLASGDIIGLLMSDDWLEKGSLSAVAGAFSDNDGVSIVAGAICVSDGENSMPLDTVPAGNDPLNLSRILGTPYGAGFFVTGELWRNLKGFDQTYRYGADRDFLMRAWIHAAPALGLAEQVYTYRRHDRSHTLGSDEKPIMAFLNDHLIMARRWLEVISDNSVRRSILAWRRNEAIALTRLYVKHRAYGALRRMLIAQSRLDPAIPLLCAMVVLRGWAGLIRRKLRPRFRAS